MARFNKITPVLLVADMQAAIDWYTGILGFDVLWRSPDDAGGEIAMLQAGATNLMLSTGSHLGSTPAFTGTLYFDVDGVGELFERIKDQVELVWPLEDQEYGLREFGIRDRDGYVLAFAQELPANS